MSNPGDLLVLPAGYAAMSSGGGNKIQFLQSGAPIVANMADMATYSTADWNNWEFVNQTLYDSAVYPAAGTVQLSFFQTPQGSGVGFGGGAKSLSDTNMVLNGQLPTGQMFVASSVEIEFQPTTPTVAAQMPAAFGAQAIAQIVNDAYVFWRSGNIQITILQKKYLQEAPLMRLPSQSDFSVQAAVADISTTGASFQSRIAFASAYGPVYSLSPNNLLIPSTTNFIVQLAWPEGLQALPSTNPARTFVRLGGMQARVAQ